MNGTIICAVGNKEETDSVVPVAAEIGERFGARVVLVGIAESVVDAPGTEGLAGARTQVDVRKRLDSITAANDLVGRVEHRVEVGDPVDTLVEVAGEEAAELIVIGARPGVLKRTLRSAFARDLAAAAPCPVVVVPPGEGSNGRTRSRVATRRAAH